MKIRDGARYKLDIEIFQVIITRSCTEILFFFLSEKSDTVKERRKKKKNCRYKTESNCALGRANGEYGVTKKEKIEENDRKRRQGGLKEESRMQPEIDSK